LIAKLLIESKRKTFDLATKARKKFTQSVNRVDSRRDQFSAPLAIQNRRLDLINYLAFARQLADSLFDRQIARCIIL
jgi:hypothetical protein